MSKIANPNPNPKIIAHILSTRPIEKQKLQNQLKTEKDLVSIKMKLLYKAKNKGMLSIGEHENKNVVFDTDSDTVNNKSKGVAKLICYSSSQQVITATSYNQTKDSKLSSYLVKSQRNKEIRQLEEEKKSNKRDFTIIIPGQEKGLNKTTLTKSERRFDKISTDMSSSMYSNTYYNAFSNNLNNSKGNINSNRKEMHLNRSTINLGCNSNYNQDSSMNYNEPKSSKHGNVISPFSFTSGFDVMASPQRNFLNGTKSSSTIFGKAGNDKFNMSNYSRDCTIKLREDQGGRVNLLKSIDFYNFIRMNHIAEVKYIQMMWRSHYRFEYRITKIVLLQSFWRRYWLRVNLYYVIKRYYRAWAFVKHLKKHCRKYLISYWWRFLKKLKITPKFAQSSTQCLSQSQEIRKLNATIAKMKCVTMQTYTPRTEDLKTSRGKTKDMNTLTGRIFSDGTPMKNYSSKDVIIEKDTDREIIEQNALNEKEIIPLQIESQDISIIMDRRDRDKERERVISPKKVIPLEIESHNVDVNILMKTKRKGKEVVIVKKEFETLKIQSQKMNMNYIVKPKKSTTKDPKKESKSLQIMSEHLNILMKKTDVILPPQVVIKPFEIDSQHMNILMKQKEIIIPIQQVIKPFKISSQYMNILTKQKKAPIIIEKEIIPFEIESQAINILTKQKKIKPFKIDSQRLNILSKKSKDNKPFRIQSQNINILTKQKKVVIFKIQSQKFNLLTTKPQESLIIKPKTLKIESQKFNLIAIKPKELLTSNIKKKILPFKIESQDINILTKPKIITPLEIISQDLSILINQKDNKQLKSSITEKGKNIKPFKIQSQEIKIIIKQKKVIPFKIQTQYMNIITKQKKVPIIQPQKMQPLEVITQCLSILMKPKDIIILPQKTIKPFKIASQHMNILTKQKKPIIFKIQSNNLNILTKPKKIKPLEIISSNINILMKIKDIKPYKIQSNSLNILIKNKEAVKLQKEIKPLKISTQNTMNIITKQTRKTPQPLEIQSNTFNISVPKQKIQNLSIIHQTNTFIDNSINIKANHYEKLYLQLQKEVEDMKIMLEKKKFFAPIDYAKNDQFQLLLQEIEKPKDEPKEKKIQSSFISLSTISNEPTFNITGHSSTIENQPPILSQNSFDFNIIQTESNNKKTIINIKKNIITTHPNSINDKAWKSKSQNQTAPIEEIIYEIVPLSISKQVNEFSIEKETNDKALTQRDTFGKLLSSIANESIMLSYKNTNRIKDIDKKKVEFLNDKTSFDIIATPLKMIKKFDIESLIIDHVEPDNKPKITIRKKQLYKSKNKKKNLTTVNTSSASQSQEKEIAEEAILKSKVNPKPNLILIEDTPLLKKIYLIDLQLNHQLNSNIKRFNIESIQLESNDDFIVKGENTIVEEPLLSIEQIDLQCLETIKDNDKPKKDTKQKNRNNKNKGKTISIETEIPNMMKTFDLQDLTSDSLINVEYLQQKPKGKKLKQKLVIEDEPEAELETKDNSHNNTLRSKTKKQMREKETKPNKEYNIDSYDLNINSIYPQRHPAINQSDKVESFSLGIKEPSISKKVWFNEIKEQSMLQLPLRSNLFFSLLSPEKPQSKSRKNTLSSSRSHLSNCFMKYISSETLLKDQSITPNLNPLIMNQQSSINQCDSFELLSNTSNNEYITKSNQSLIKDKNKFLMSLPLNTPLQIPLLTESIFTRYQKARPGLNEHFTQKCLRTDSFDITLKCLYEYDDLVKKIITENHLNKLAQIKQHIQEQLEFLSKEPLENKFSIKSNPQEILMKAILPMKLKKIITANTRKEAFEQIINGMKENIINKQKTCVVSIRNMHENKALKKAFKTWNLKLISSRIYEEIERRKMNNMQSYTWKSMEMITLNGIKKEPITEYEQGNQMTIQSTQNDDYMVYEQQTQDIFDILQSSSCSKINKSIEEYKKNLITKFTQTEHLNKSLKIKKTSQVEFEGKEHEEIIAPKNRFNVQRTNENSITLTSYLPQWKINRLKSSNENCITLTSDFSKQRMSLLGQSNENSITLSYQKPKPPLTISKRSFYYKAYPKRNSHDGSDIFVYHIEAIPFKPTNMARTPKTLLTNLLSVESQSAIESISSKSIRPRSPMKSKTVKEEEQPIDLFKQRKLKSIIQITTNRLRLEECKAFIRWKLKLNINQEPDKQKQSAKFKRYRTAAIRENKDEKALDETVNQMKRGISLIKLKNYLYKKVMKQAMIKWKRIFVRTEKRTYTLKVVRNKNLNLRNNQDINIQMRKVVKTNIVKIQEKDYTFERRLLLNCINTLNRNNNDVYLLYYLQKWHKKLTMHDKDLPEHLRPTTVKTKIRKLMFLKRKFRFWKSLIKKTVPMPIQQETNKIIFDEAPVLISKKELKLKRLINKKNDLIYRKNINKWRKQCTANEENKETTGKVQGLRIKKVTKPKEKKKTNDESSSSTQKTKKMRLYKKYESGNEEDLKEFRRKLIKNQIVKRMCSTNDYIDISPKSDTILNNMIAIKLSYDRQILRKSFSQLVENTGIILRKKSIIYKIVKRKIKQYKPKSAEKTYFIIWRYITKMLKQHDTKYSTIRKAIFLRNQSHNKILKYYFNIWHRPLIVKSTKITLRLYNTKIIKRNQLDFMQNPNAYLNVLSKRFNQWRTINQNEKNIKVKSKAIQSSTIQQENKQTLQSNNMAIEINQLPKYILLKKLVNKQITQNNLYYLWKYYTHWKNQHATMSNDTSIISISNDQNKLDVIIPTTVSEESKPIIQIKVIKTKNVYFKRLELKRSILFQYFSKWKTLPTNWNYITITVKKRKHTIKRNIIFSFIRNQLLRQSMAIWKKWAMIIANSHNNSFSSSILSSNSKKQLRQSLCDIQKEKYNRSQIHLKSNEKKKSVQHCLFYLFNQVIQSKFIELNRELYHYSKYQSFISIIDSIIKRKIFRKQFDLPDYLIKFAANKIQYHYRDHKRNIILHYYIDLLGKIIRGIESKGKNQGIMKYLTMRLWRYKARNISQSVYTSRINCRNLFMKSIIRNKYEFFLSFIDCYGEYMKFNHLNDVLRRLFCGKIYALMKTEMILTKYLMIKFNKGYNYSNVFFIWKRKTRLLMRKDNSLLKIIKVIKRNNRLFAFKQLCFKK